MSIPRDDSEEWGTINEAAGRSGSDLTHLDIHRLCNDGTLPYRVDDKGAWLIHIPSLREYLRRITGLDHGPIVVRAVEYAALLGHLSRIEGKIDTIIEGNIRMTQADNQIEADVASLKATFSSVSELIAALNATNAALQAAAAAGQAPSAQTLSDLDAVTSQLGGLVPPAATDPTGGTSSDTPPTSDDGGATGAADLTPPADDSASVPDTSETVDPTQVDVSSPVNDTSDPGVDPVSGGALVGEPPAVDVVPADDTVGQPAPSTAQPQSP